MASMRQGSSRCGRWLRGPTCIASAEPSGCRWLPLLNRGRSERSPEEGDGSGAFRLLVSMLLARPQHRRQRLRVGQAVIVADFDQGGFRQAAVPDQFLAVGK